MGDLIKSPLNFTGGKYRLLPQILPLFPEKIETFLDLFCGGANVGINSWANRTIYNDNNQSLVELYKVFKKYDYSTVCKRIENIIQEFKLSDSTANGYEYYGCESGKGLGKYNKDHYMDLRKSLNERAEKDDEYYLQLFTLIIFAFNNQIRFNNKGQFNLPVGKRDFNESIRGNLERFIKVLHNQENEFCSKDFREFDLKRLGRDAFVYCDPPYLITTASYNESHGWTSDDEKDLLVFLDKLNAQDIKFALSNVTKHKGRVNEILVDWAKRYNVHILDFNYSNSSYHGKNKDETTQEVLITNY